MAGSESSPSTEALAAWLPGQRWFASKTRRIVAVAYEDTVPLAGARLALLRVQLENGSTDRYAVPLAGDGRCLDALDDPGFAHALLDLIARDGWIPGVHGQLWGQRTRAFPRDLGNEIPVRRLGGEQSNTSIVFGAALLLKQFRRLPYGVNPEREITRFLTERTSFLHTPRLAGDLEYRAASGETATLAVVQEFVHDARDGWQWILGELHELGERARAAGSRAATPGLRDLARPTLEALRRLGERTGQLHRALASDPNEPDFAPEPISEAHLQQWTDDVRRQVDEARVVLGRLPVSMPDVAHGLAGLSGIQRIRHHGDLHFGQTLYLEARADFMIIDFEGEPLRPLAQRRLKHAALRDVAGMRRSIDYAAASAGGHAPDEWLAIWRSEAAGAFTAGYRAATQGAPFLPSGEKEFERAVAVFELEKAAYEIVYEANNRPDWVSIPTRGLVSAAAALSAGGSAGVA